MMSEIVPALIQLFDVAFIRTLLGGLLLLLGAGLGFLVARKIAVTMVNRMIALTGTQWDDALANRGVFTQATYLAPAVVLYYGISFFPGSTDIVGRVILTYVVVNIVIVISRLLAAGTDIYQTYPVSHRRPIKGYIQLANLAVYLFGGVLAACTLLSISPWGILSGLGAVTALLILVFRDTILSLIASVQIAAYDLVRPGDWIEMSQLGVDGDVIDVALHTIRVQNWDKTIITIPTHKLIEGSFKNWRGMAESGGRRIKRSILIDQTSIKFLDKVALDRLSQINRLEPYLTGKQQELAGDNADFSKNTDLLNQRVLTNVGTFRAYIEAYLRDNPKIHQGMTFLVRQLPASPQGLPLEVYVFTNDTEWGPYESIQADIFDHLLAALPTFELRVFQNPTGFDMHQLGGTFAATLDN